MVFRMRYSVVLLSALLSALLTVSRASSQVAPAPTQTAPAAADPLAQLTSDQRDQFKRAAQLIGTEDYASALVILKPLVAQLAPASSAQVLLAKYTAEAAINTGDRDYALTLLKPIAAADPADWQASSLLVRAYAEAGDKARRDAELAHLMELHQHTTSPQFAKLTQFLIERIKTKTGSVRIWYSLVPWGQYKTYIYARVYDEQGQQTLRVTLESSDFDQPLWAKNHPDRAAKGERMFSMDGYGQDKKNDNGTVTQTHMTFGVIDGQPTYAVVRDRIVSIADKQTAPISSMQPGSGK